ncbi:MAG TPA: hypothetical protein VGL09_16850 [Methylomirabilota bacterium]|jgi:hypothetical protein
MLHRLALISAALCLAVAAGAWAEEVKGTIQSVDPSGRILTLTDGRIVHLEPSTRVLVDNKVATIESLKPGTQVLVVTGPAAAAPGTVAVTAPPPHPPVDASGTVASIDPQSRVITFQDGRMVQATDRTVIWQPMQIGTLRPGTQVFVRDAQPVGYRQSWSTLPAGTSREMMGTVMRVDQGQNLILLSDGTVIRVSPNTKLQMGNQQVPISQLQPGTEVVVRVNPATTTTTTAASSSSTGGSALPRQGGFFGATLDASEVLIVRRPESP